jgi:uncharacterized membrane protein
MTKFIKATLLGGVVFLIPITVCIILLAKVHRFMERLTAPLANWLPMDTVAGYSLSRILAVAAIIAVCFIAGLLARSRLTFRWIEKLESGVLHSIPGYTFIKGVSGGLAEPEDELTPVLAKFDDVSQPAFQVDQLEDGRIVLFLPGAPDPSAGSLVVMTPDRVEPIGTSMASVVRNLRSLGKDSSQLLAKKE